MRIAIDARAGAGTGIGRYARRLVEHLAALDTGHEFVVLVAAGDEARWGGLAESVRVMPSRCPPYGWREQLVLPWVLCRLQPDVVHFTHPGVPLVVRPRRRVTTVHDLTLLAFRNATGSGWRRARYEFKHRVLRFVLGFAVVTSRRVITPTEFVRAAVLERYRRWRWLPTRVQVVAEGGGIPIDSDPAPPVPPAPFLLYVGSSYPHKNLDLLLDAFAAVRRRHGDLELVLVGPDDHFARQLCQRARAQGLNGQVRMPGYVGDAELGALYGQAAAFVFPSLSEGFGLPPLEAMAHGTPVIAARASCLPEVCGDAAVYFDPHDAGDLARAIEAVLGDDVLRRRLRAAGPVRNRQFSWPATATETLALYLAVAG